MSTLLDELKPRGLIYDQTPGLEARLARMRNRPTGQPESAYEKARREALAGAQVQELRLWLRSMLSEAERGAFLDGQRRAQIDALGRLARDPTTEIEAPEMNDRNERQPVAPTIIREQPIEVRGVRRIDAPLIRAQLLELGSDSNENAS